MFLLPFRRIFFLCVPAWAIAGCGHPPVELSLITPVQETDRAIAEDLAAFAGRHSGLTIRLIPPPDGQSTLDALASGYGDIAFASNDQPWREDITTILPLYPTVLHIVVRQELVDKGISQIPAGARVFAGPVGSASRLLMENILARFEFNLEDVHFLDAGSEEPPDIVVIYAAIDPSLVRERMKESPVSYQLFQFGKPEDVGTGANIDRITLLNPRVRPFVIPVGTYDEFTPEPTLTVAVDKLLVARSDLPAPAAHDLLREVLQMRPALSGKRPAIFASLDESFDPDGHAFALHRGARAYLERNEPGWAERYSGIGEVLVALTVALISGTIAVINIYNRRRKNRIDVFYKKVFVEVESIEDAATVDDLQQAVQNLRGLQKTAFDQLIAEKLAADESFRIFMSLSNDAINEFSRRQRSASPGP